jgi:hypothetical protein
MTNDMHQSKDWRERFEYLHGSRPEAGFYTISKADLFSFIAHLLEEAVEEERRNIIEDTSERMAAEKAAVTDRTLSEVLATYRLTPETVKSAGYRVLIEKDADSEEYVVLAKVVERKRIPKLVYPS